MRLSRFFASCLLVTAGILSGVPSAGQVNIPGEDYALYDQVVTSKFLTSGTELVVLERMTVARLVPNQDGPLTPEVFAAHGFFDGELPKDLIRDFLVLNESPSRLEGRFQFGARYRFVSGGSMEEPEVRRAVPAALIQASVVDRLAFSRVGRTLRNHQALVFVENTRPDGTGAGFLIWFRRDGSRWAIHDTEVVWTVRHVSPEESPLLAP